MLNLYELKGDRKMTVGRLADTGERVEMQMTGYWVAGGGRHVSSYERVGGEPDGKYRQYSMDRHHNFYVETED